MPYKVQEIIHQLRVHPHKVKKMNTRNMDDFITSNNQVQMRPVQHQEKKTLSSEMKRKLDTIID